MRRRRLLPGLVVLLALAPPALAEETTLHLGPIQVTALTSDVPSCAAQLPTLPCPLGYDHANTLTPTDDTLYQYRSLESLTIAADTGLPAQGITLDLGRTRVNHTLINTADAALYLARDLLPAPLRDRTSIEQGKNDSVLVVWLTDSDPVTGSALGVPVHVLAPYTDRQGTRLPHGIALEDSDEWVPRNLEYLRLCHVPQIEDRFPACDKLPLTRELPAMWASLSPRIMTGAHVNKTTVSLGPGAAPASAASSPEGSPTTAQPAWVRGFGPPATEALRLDPMEQPLRDRPAEPEVVHAGGHEPLPATLATSGTSDPANLPLLLAAAALLLAPLLRLYQRVTRTRALEHAHRARLLELARAQPGLLVGEAAKRLGITYHCARHHARTLERCGHVELARAGRHHAVYPSFTVPLSQRAALVHLRRGPQAEVLRILQAQPGLTLTQARALLGGSKSAVHAKLRRLEAQGLVERQGRWGYHPTLLGHEALNLLHRPGTGEPSLPLTPRAGTPS